MGVGALDTADRGLNQVTAAYDVPAGCVAPPGPPVVSITATVATGNEAGATPASVTIRRDAVSNRSLTIAMFIGGSATSGVDYAALAPVTIPAGAAETTLSVVPIDDALLEGNETVTITLSAAAGYIVGSPSIATVTITSDDVAPDLTVSALTAPAKAAPGGTIAVTDTTRNQGTGAGPASQTSFYLSRDVFLDGADSLLGSRPVEALPVGAASTATASVTLPGDLATGTYFLFAKADGPANYYLKVNGTNNHRASAISVGPDSPVTSFTAPAAAAAGSAIAVSDTTTNQGSAPAPASITSFYLSSNVVFDASDVLLGSRGLAAMAAGATSTAGTSVTLPATLATGTYYLFAQADGGAAIAELNEMNNGKASAIRTDLDPRRVVVQRANSRSGGWNHRGHRDDGQQRLHLAAASTTAFYLSLNLTVEPGDVRLGDWAEPCHPLPLANPARRRRP